MTHDAFQPEYLFRLAKSGNDTDRLHLAQAVMSFLQTELRPSEQKIAEEVLLLLLKEAAHELRLSLAEQLAREENCPMALIDYLVYENPLEISSPVLQFSTVPDDDYLLEVARHFQKTEYWQVLARRSHVSETLSRFLVSTDDTNVFRLLLKNRGAHLCAASMNWLADVAPDLPEIQKPLLSRPEVTPELAAKLYWHVSVDLRNQITARFDINQSQIDVLLDKAVKQRLAEREADAEITPDMIDRAEQMKEQNSITSHQMLEALKKDDLLFFTCLWGALLSLPPEFVAARLDEDFATNMAAMCKAANITSRDYNLFFLLWRRKRKYLSTNSMELSAAMDYFNRLKFEEAWGRVHHWLTESGANPTLH